MKAHEFIVPASGELKETIRNLSGDQPQPDTVQVPRETLKILKACASWVSIHGCSAEDTKDRARAALKELEKL